MINVVDLKTSVYTVLSSLDAGLKVYEWGRVPEDAVLPYLIYKVGNTTEGSRDDYDALTHQLELQIFNYDKTKSTDYIEGKLVALDNLMDRKSVLESAFYWRAERETIGFDGLPTENEFTQRRRAVYGLKVYPRY